MKNLLSPLPHTARLSACLLAMMSLLLQSGTAKAQEKSMKKVGIAVSAVVNTSIESGLLVSEALGEAIAKKLNVHILAGVQAQALLPANARDESCLGQSSCLTEAGKALGVDELLMLIIIDIGENYKIEATWINVHSGVTALRPAMDLPKSAELQAASLESQVQALLPDIASPPDIISPPDISTPPDILAKTDIENSDTNTKLKKTPSQSGRKWSTTSKVLFYGGGAVLTGYLGYGGFRFIRCDFGFDCDRSTKREGRDTIADTIGAVGLASASVGLLLYLISTSDKESPLALNVDGDSLGLSYLGAF